MTKEIYISTTPHETRLAIVEDEQLAEVHYERENEYTLAGAIYNGKVTRVLPGMQSAFVDVGLERDAFLYVTDFLEEQEDWGEFENGTRMTVSPLGSLTRLCTACRIPASASDRDQTTSLARCWVRSPSPRHSGANRLSFCHVATTCQRGRENHRRC